MSDGRLSKDNSHNKNFRNTMARWPKNAWTTIYTYGSVFVLFPLLAFLCYAWVRGWF